MNTIKSFLSLIVLTFILMSCNKKDDPQPENTVIHVGEKWNIVSADYTLVNQDLSKPTNVSVVNETGTASNVGAFYFNSGKGTFDITIKGINKQDYFSYSESGSEVTVTSISQSAGSTSVSQNVIALSGEKTSATSMTVQGSITKQSMTGQFLLSGTFVLQKN